mgnify:CR=1 FL=1
MERRLVKNLDLLLLGVVLALVVIGLLTIFSATRANTAINGGNPYLFVEKQFISVIIGLVGMVLLIGLDYRLSDLAYRLIYGVNIILLVAVILFGTEVNGAKSWLNLGFYSLQPSEFAKLAVILTLAKHLSEKEKLSSIWDLLSPFLHILLPLVLILLQPDFGTALVFVFIFFVMLYMAGTNGRLLLGIILLGVLLIVLVFGCHHFFNTPLPLKDYQIKRLTSFINPDADPRGSGWNVNQAKIAVGSGRFFGKGIFQNTQGRLGFLPENHTDFIFAVFCEEWGFIGGFILLGLFFFLIWRSLRIAVQAKERCGSLIAIGIMAMFTFHVLENVGMNMSIMPITGIPLPFISSGGSSMMANLFAIGYLENIWARRQKILF